MNNDYVVCDHDQGVVDPEDHVLLDPDLLTYL
jgi:hypothetical protein